MQSMSLSASQVQGSHKLAGSGSGSLGEEGDLKKNLYESMKNAGVLNALKSQLRSKLYD